MLIGMRERESAQKTRNAKTGWRRTNRKRVGALRLGKEKSQQFKLATATEQTRINSKREKNGLKTTSTQE